MATWSLNRLVLYWYVLSGCYAFRYNAFRNKHYLPPIRLSMSQLDKNAESVKLLAGISSVGVLDTGYLSWMKVSSSQLVCGSDCNNVLSGPYSNIPYINLPLSVFGLFGYIAIATLSFREILNNESIDMSARSALLALTTSMATFSFYLMGVLQLIIMSGCPYCYASAFMSLAMIVVAWSKEIVPNKTKSAVIVLSSSSITALSSALLFYLTTTLNPSEAFARPPDEQVAVATTTSLAEQIKEEFEPPTVTKESSSKALAVAAELKEVGAKMYGAYWCSHCYNQKQNLGTGAYKSFEYVECDKKGKNSQYPLCKSKQLKGYPTWEIAGQFFPGEKTVDELDELLKGIVGGSGLKVD